MHRLLPLIACLLAAIWLPATLHCGLESVGMLAHDHGDAVEKGCAVACSEDACAVVEGGAYKSALKILKVPGPAMADVLIALLVEPPEPVLIFPVAPGDTESPPELARTWQFTARAALLPGAPAFVS